MTFHLLVEELKNLSVEEKEEMKNILEKYLIEEKRKEFQLDYEKSLKEYEKEKLTFSNDIKELKKSLE